MKNPILFFIISCLLFVGCAGKKMPSTDRNVPQPSFGVKAGVNFSDINGPDVESFNGKTSFHVGAVAEIPVSDNFAVQPELLYSEQGSDYEEESFDGTVSVNYLNIPVMAKFEVAEGLSVEAGPQIGFLLSAKDEYDFEGGSEEEDIKDQLKGTDFGLNFGLGYKLENGLNFSARYNLGLSNVNDGDIDDGAEYKNGVFQIGIGFLFN